MIESSVTNLTIARPDPQSIQQAVSLLKEGLLVAMPTETVYGLAADATNKLALKRLYAAKGRPTSHPVIVHIHSPLLVSAWAIDVPASFYMLTEKYWPGPLTVVLRRAPSVLDEVTGGQDTVALRMPQHPVALQLLRAFDIGIAAPSANKFGHVSPTTAAHVRQEFSESEVGLVLDGGACQVGIESTIVDLTGVSPRILRPGMITEPEIKQSMERGSRSIETSQSTADRAADGAAQDAAHGISGSSSRQQDLARPLCSSQAVRVPGSLPSHYSPRTPLYLVSSTDLVSWLREVELQEKKVGVVALVERTSDTANRVWRTMPADAQSYARNMYKVLRELDDLNLDMIICESPAEDSHWHAILDRLRRAATRATR
jgi:L-threonylcarbamoyladenylate synthase